MVNVNFKGKIRKVGNSNIVTIPAAYVENKMLEPAKEYRFEVTEEMPDVE